MKLRNLQLLKAYVDEDVYDPPLQDANIPYDFDFLDDVDNMYNDQSMEQPPRPIATPFTTLSFPSYLPGRRLFWIEQVEAFFSIAGIDTDEERFDYVVLHADIKFIAPFLNRILQWPKKLQPRAWKDLKIYFMQNIPAEKLVTDKRPHVCTQHGNSDTPKMSDIPTKNDTPVKSSMPKKSDFPNKNETLKKSGTAEKGKH